MSLRAVLIAVALLVLGLALCVVISFGGLIWYAASGDIDIPYHDPPPTASTLP